MYRDEKMAGPGGNVQMLMNRVDSQKEASRREAASFQAQKQVQKGAAFAMVFANIMENTGFGPMALPTARMEAQRRLEDAFEPINKYQSEETQRDIGSKAVKISKATGNLSDVEQFLGEFRKINDEEAARNAALVLSRVTGGKKAQISEALEAPDVSSASLSLLALGAYSQPAERRKDPETEKREASERLGVALDIVGGMSETRLGYAKAETLERDVLKEMENRKPVTLWELPIDTSALPLEGTARV